MKERLLRLLRRSFWKLAGWKLRVWKRKEIEGTIIDWLLGAEKLGETKFYEFVPNRPVKGDKSFFEKKEAFVS